jgi:hypothetical protein
MCPRNETFFYCFTRRIFLSSLQSFFVARMTSANETLLAKQHFFDNHLPRLKPIGEHGIADKDSLQRQPKLRSSSILPPVSQNFAAGSTITNSTVNSPPSSVTYTSTVREAALRFITRNNPPSQIANNNRLKRVSLYDHIQPKIDTGLPRTESIARTENDTYRLGPVRPIIWRLLKQELEQDTQIRAHSKRIQFNSGVTYAKQLTTLGDLVRTKTRSHISAVMGYGEERYKMVVHLTVFQTIAAGLHIASRCLWNTFTDNSITIKMQGVDCDILIVIFLCYTDLGPSYN